MPRRIILFLIVMLILSSASLFAADAERHSYKSRDGYVPDEATAIRIAEAIWLPIYGDTIYTEKPFKARLENRVWIVEGSLPEGHKGGVAEIEIAKDDGKILRVSHSK